MASGYRYEDLEAEWQSLNKAVNFCLASVEILLDLVEKIGYKVEITKSCWSRA